MKGHKKILLISLVMAIILIINSFAQIFNLFTYSLFLLASFLIVKKIVGFEKDSFPDRKELVIVLVSGVFLYYILTYSTVFFWGILQNRVGLTFSALINNIIPFFLIIIFSELLRFIIIRKGRGYKLIWIISVLLFSLMEITIKVKGYDFSLNIDIIKFSVEIVSVTLIKNIFLCYLVNRSGYKASILFRLLFDLPLYILPFFPNLGIFLDSVFKMLLPLVLLLTFLFKYSFINRNDIIKTKGKSEIAKNISYGMVIVVLLIVVGLTSAKFKYFTIVVGSGSMRPNIDKGDVVLVKKVANLSSIKENDILVFKHDKITVIHRIVRIEIENDEITFYTKGDANDSEDNYPIRKSDVIGVAQFKIKYIGYPTVWINEQIKASQ